METQRQFGHNLIKNGPNEGDLRFLVSLYGPGNISTIRRGINYANPIEANQQLAAVDAQFFKNYALRYNLEPSQASSFFKRINYTTNRLRNEVVSTMFPNNGKDIRAPLSFQRAVESPSLSFGLVSNEELPQVDPYFFYSQGLMHDIVAQLTLREESYNFPQRIIDLREAITDSFMQENGENMVEKNIYSLHDNVTNKAIYTSEYEENMDARQRPGLHKKTSSMRVFEVDGLSENGERVDVAVFYRVKSLFSSVIKALDKAPRADKENGHVNIDRDVTDVDGALIVVNEPHEKLQRIIDRVQKKLYSYYGKAEDGGRIVAIEDDSKTNFDPNSNENRAEEARVFRRIQVHYTDGTAQEIIFDSMTGFLDSKCHMNLAQEVYNLKRISHAATVLSPAAFRPHVQTALSQQREIVREKLRNTTYFDFRDDGFQEIMDYFNSKAEATQFAG